MRLSPFAAVVAACVLTLAACGDDGSDPKSSDASDSSSSDSSKTDGDQGGMDKETDARPKDICKTLDGQAVSDVIGYKVKRGPIAQGSCTFADPEGLSRRAVAVTYLKLAAAGGADAVLGGVSAAAQAEPEEVPDVGDQAYVAVNEVASEPWAAGAVLIDDSLFQVKVIPADDASAGDAKESTVAMLELIAESV